MTDTFPMVFPPSFFDNAVNFRLKGNKTFLDVKFNKHTRFTFRDCESHYAIVTSSMHYDALRVWQEYHFQKAKTQVECWVDSKLVDHIKLTVQTDAGTETLELIRG